MRALEPTKTSEPDQPAASGPRRALGNLGLQGVVALMWLGAALRRLRYKLVPQRWRYKFVRPRQLAPSTVIISFPEQAWRGRRAEATTAAIQLALERIGRRWPVSTRPVPSVTWRRPRQGEVEAHKLEEAGIEEHTVRGLTRSYLCLATAPGLENDVVRAIRVAAWRSGLRGGRHGVIALRTPLLSLAASTDPPGEIVFHQPAYNVAKQLIGANRVVADKATIMIVDLDPPAMDFLEDIPSKVDILPDPNAQAVYGHATLLTKVVADIAPKAHIIAVALGHDEGAAPWGLISVLLKEQDVDVIVASLSLRQGSDSRKEIEQADAYDSTLRQRRHQPHHPPVLFPTGNYKKPDPINTLAVPARFEGAIAVGACEIGDDPAAPEIRRSAGSRYGEKTSGDSSAWWLAPGGSFDEDRVSGPLATMGGRPQAGTSIANAIAGGLAAGIVARLKQRPLTPDLEFEKAFRQVQTSLGTTAGAEEALGLLRSIRDNHKGEVVTTDGLIQEFQQLARQNQIGGYQIRGYHALEHGKGLLCLD
jgi:hypothetical protein